MKKLLTIIIATTLMMLLVGCGLKKEERYVWGMKMIDAKIIDIHSNSVDFLAEDGIEFSVQEDEIVERCEGNVGKIALISVKICTYGESDEIYYEVFADAGMIGVLDKYEFDDNEQN